MAIIHSLYRESGTPAIDAGACTRCGACIAICPSQVLRAGEGGLPAPAESLLGCIACGHCMMVCPADAVTVTGRGAEPSDLVPLPDLAVRAGAGQLEALMRARRSVRRFGPRPVEAEMLERIVAMASTAPMGIPPWDVGCVIVRGRDEVQVLAAEVVRGYEGLLKIFKPWLLAALRPILGRAKHAMFAGFVRPLAQSYVQARRAGRDLVFYDAPALLLFHHSPYADAVDAAIACTYAMLAAESLGLGATMIGGAPPILQRNPALCRRLGIPAGSKSSHALILGYPAAPFRRAIRRRFSHVSRVGGG